MSENQSEKEIRLGKLQKLRELGVDPYPSYTPEHVFVSDALTKSEGDEIAIVGRISAIRDHGKAVFYDIQDDSGKMQVYIKSEGLATDKQTLLPLFDIGDYLWFKGELFVTKTGQLSIKVADFELLAKSILPVPEHWHGLTDVETRYRQRSLDFKINKDAKEVIRTRSLITRYLQDYLERHEFLEINTPVLQTIPGGATAKPFITKYNILDADFYLRISPELYLKRLIAGGFERVFEIGPVFRNEGLSHQHSPEFMMCEFYWAYKTYRDLMPFTQKMLQDIVQKTTGEMQLEYQGEVINFAGEWPVYEYGQLISQATEIDIYAHADFESLSEAVKAKNIELNWKEIKTKSKLVDELFKKVCRPQIIQPTFVIDYPIELSPLAKSKPDNDQQVERFQLILAGGVELVNAYSELNDPLEQEKRMQEQAKLGKTGWDEAMMIDNNYVEALSFGMPPTAGWGMGVSRLTMILTNQYSIKEVIPFPTLKPENTKK